MKKFLNGISRTLCVMAISVFAVCIFAGCNYAGDNAGTPPVIPQPEKVSEPAFSLQPGAVDYGDTVAITCATEGASIYYTTDGTDPSAESSSYTSSIEITSDTTIKAFATKFGMTSSEVAVASYTVKKYTITFDANGHSTAPDAFTGKHKGEKITLQELSETGYTFDGWTDGEKNFAAGTEYIITSDVTLKAKWIGWNDVTTPTFSVTAGEVDYGDTVALSCGTDGAEIYYTTDSTAPTSASTKYTSPITITSDTTIKAIALKSGMNDSAVAEKAYVIKTYTVIFDADGHGIAPDAITGKHKGEKIILPSAITANGWAFVNWNDGTTDYAAGADYTVAGDVTIKAVWKEIPNVTNLTATCPASGTVKLTWTNPTDADFVKVIITYDTDKSVTVLKTDSPNNEVTITGLTNGTEYTFTVKTYDNSENASNGVSEKATPPTPAELTQAGTRPSNVTGTQTLPTFKTDITDHLYLAASSANVTGCIECYEISNASKYQWYTGTTGNWQKVASSGTPSPLKITVTTGTTYYMLEAKSADGQSIAYSNVCTVICGGEKTADIGKIAYNDGTYSSEYLSLKTPIGIIFDVNADGTPKTIVNLNQSSSTLMWCSSSAQGYSKNFVTDVTSPLSYTDGSGNWQIICDNVTDESTDGNYPAFEYCNGLTDGGKTWYLPARDELKTLYFNRAAVNTAIATLKAHSITATPLPPSGFYWFFSSSQYASENYYACVVFFDLGTQFYDFKYDNGTVRGVAGF